MTAPHPMLTAPPARRRTSRAVQLLWLGQSVSLLGDQVTVLALPLAALAGGGSVSQVAVLVGATSAPFLLLGLPAGVWVGRIGLRRSMLIADVVRAAALASLPAGALLGTVTYVHLLLVALLVGCGSVLFQVAYQSLTPLLVDDADQLRSANTRLTASEAVSLTAGPALAGLLIGTAGALRALALDAASFAVSAGTLVAFTAPADQPARKKLPMYAEIHAGFRYTLGNPPLRAVLWSSVLFNAGQAGYEALLVVFAVQRLGLSPTTLGLAIGIGGVGVPIGLLLSGPVQRRLGIGPVLIVSGGLSGGGVLIASMAPTGPLAGPLIAIGTFVMAVGGGAWGLTALTTRQSMSRPDMRAMVTAVHRWATYGVVPVGAVVAGLAARILGVRPALIVAGALAQLCVVPLLRSPVRKLRTLALATGQADLADDVDRTNPAAVPGRPARR